MGLGHNPKKTKNMEIKRITGELGENDFHSSYFLFVLALLSLDFGRLGFRFQLQGQSQIRFYNHSLQIRR